MRKGIVAVAMVFVVVVAVLAWAHRPRVSPPEPTGLPEYHAVDIVIEETNVFRIIFRGAFEGFSPDRVRQEGKIVHEMYIDAGLGHMSVGVKEYIYVFAYFYVHVWGIVERLLGGKGWRNYLLAFFNKSNDVGELFRSYGLPHTYAKATYYHVSDGSVITLFTPKVGYRS